MSKIWVWIKKKNHSLIKTAVHEPKKIAAFLVATNALLQLAISQSHIESLVKVKLTTSLIGASNYTSGMPSYGIGMFMFLFILFGLATIFNITRATTIKRSYIGIGSIIVTLIFGTVYILKLTNPDSLVDFSDVSKSFYWMIIGFAVYLVVAGFMIYDIYREKRLHSERK